MTLLEGALVLLWVFAGKRMWFVFLVGWSQFRWARQTLRRIRSGDAFITSASGERFLPGVRPDREADVVRQKRKDYWSGLIMASVPVVAAIGSLAVLIFR